MFVVAFMREGDFIAFLDHFQMSRACHVLQVQPVESTRVLSRPRQRILGLDTAWDTRSFHILAARARASVDSKATLVDDVSTFAFTLLVDNHGPPNASRCQSRISLQFIKRECDVPIGILACRNVIVI